VRFGENDLLPTAEARPEAGVLTLTDQLSGKKGSQTVNLQ
jgi:hypothetical protein